MREKAARAGPPSMPATNRQQAARDAPNAEILKYLRRPHATGDLAAAKAALNARILEHLRRAHEAGDCTATRCALQHCALARIVMPAWLAEVVNRAIRASERGKPDELLGFGNARMLARWRKAFLQGRDAAIRHNFEVWPMLRRPEQAGITQRQLVEATARTHRISPKAVEKIRYARKSPTFRVKK